MTETDKTLLPPSLETLRVTQHGDHVVEVTLARPTQLNSMNGQMWIDIFTFFTWAKSSHWVRCIVMSAEGRLFTSGVELQTLSSITKTSFETESSDGKSDPAAHAYKILTVGERWQKCLSAIEECGKPVISCVHGACIGGGIEMISATDIRFCTEDGYFTLKEIDVGLAADVGGLQRFPKLVGNDSLVRELAFSGRNFNADEALKLGFVSRICKDKAVMLKEALDLAKIISNKSPVGTFGVKRFLNYSRDHSVKDSLEFAIVWNMAMTQSTDLSEAAKSFFEKKTPTFKNLPRSKL